MMWNPATILYGADGESAQRVIPTQDLAVAGRQRLVGDTFKIAAVDTTLWASTVGGSGTAAASGGEARLRTGVTADSSILLRSTIVGRFLTGTANVFVSGVRLSEAGVANNRRRWGVYTATDGYYFEMEGLVLYAVVLKSGVATQIASTTWNILSTTTSPIDVTLYHRYEILYFGNTCYFVVDGVVRHKLSGQVSTPRTAKMNFPIAHENANFGGGTTDVSLFISGTAISRFGPEFSRPRFKHFDGNTTVVLKSESGTLHRVLINRQAIAFATLRLYDGVDATGVLIASIDLTKVVGFLNYGVDFSTGLYAEITNPGSVTVVFD